MKKKRKKNEPMIIPENIPPEVSAVPHETQMMAIKLAQSGLGDLQIIEFLEKKGINNDTASAAALGVRIYLGKQLRNFIPVLEVLRGIHMTDKLIAECSKIHDARGVKDGIKTRLDHVKLLNTLLKG